MTAISTNFTVNSFAFGSLLTATKMTNQMDNDVNLQEWIGASHVSSAEQDHNHNGVNSAPIVNPDVATGIYVGAESPSVSVHSAAGLNNMKDILMIRGGNVTVRYYNVTNQVPASTSVFLEGTLVNSDAVGLSPALQGVNVSNVTVGDRIFIKGRSASAGNTVTVSSLTITSASGGYLGSADFSL